MSSANSHGFASAFPIWMPFVSSSCLITLARTSRAMLNESSETGHPCSVSVLSKSIQLFTIMLVVGLSYIAFIMLRYIPSIPTVFVINGCRILSNVSSASVKVIIGFFHFVSLSY